MENNWDISSIVRSCKATTFTNTSIFCETPPQNPTTTITTSTHSIISPINTTPYCLEDFIFNQENSSVANTNAMKNNWDPSSIVRDYKVTTFTNPSTFRETPPQNLSTMVTTMATNSHVSLINTTPSYFPDFTFNQENNSLSSTSHKPNDFADLNKLRVNFNSATHIPTPTTVSIPISVPNTASSLTTTTTFSTHTTPNIITNINPNVHVSNQNSTFFNFSTHIKQNQMQPNEFTEKYSFITKFNHTTTETTMPTFATTPTTIIPITTATTFTNPTVTISTHTTTPATHPPQQKPHSKIRKNKNVVTSMCYVKEENLSKDLWQWRKYGRKSIKGSPHSRNYYKCSSCNHCPARKHVEKSETGEKTYVVTYLGEHIHPEPEVKQNSNNGTSRHKSSKARSPVVRHARSSQNFESLGSPNVTMVQSKSNNAQAFNGHSKTEFVESQSHVVGEAGPSHNVQKIDPHIRMMLQRDEPERSNADIFPGELQVSSDDNDDILISNILNLSEDFFLDFDHLNDDSILP